MAPQEHRLALLILVLTLAAPAGAQSQLHEFHGQSPFYVMSPVAGGQDLDGDSTPDVVVGVPGDDSAATNGGAVYAYSGRTGALLWDEYGLASEFLGISLAMAPDWNGDGVWDVAAVKDRGFIVVSGATGDYFFEAVFSSSGWKSVATDFDWEHDGIPNIAVGNPSESFAGPAAGAIYVVNGDPDFDGEFYRGMGEDQAYFGYALCSLDWNQDPFRDLAVGAPYHDSPSFGVDAGRVFLCTQGASSPATLDGLPASTLFGAALAPADDMDGDGSQGILIGAPYYGSFAGLVHCIEFGGVAQGFLHGSSADDGLGTSLAQIGDVDGDGVSDWVAGAPQLGAAGAPPGYARVVSGRLVTPLYDLAGDGLGNSFGSDVGGVGDVNGDGVSDVGVGAPNHNGPGGLLTGHVKVFSGGGPGFVNYCTAGTSASGCQAQLSGTGTPHATLLLSFDLIATGVQGNVDGLFFFGWNGRQANSWGNGTSYQCVVPPVKRGGLLQGSGGIGTCNGSFTQDLNALWQANPTKNPGAGAVVQAQLWYRDPASTSNQTTSLSDAIEFVLAP